MGQCSLKYLPFPHLLLSSVLFTVHLLSRPLAHGWNAFPAFSSPERMIEHVALQHSSHTQHRKRISRLLAAWRCMIPCFEAVSGRSMHETWCGQHHSRSLRGQQRKASRVSLERETLTGEEAIYSLSGQSCMIDSMEEEKAPRLADGRRTHPLPYAEDGTAGSLRRLCTRRATLRSDLVRATNWDIVPLLTAENCHLLPRGFRVMVEMRFWGLTDAVRGHRPVLSRRMATF